MKTPITNLFRHKVFVKAWTVVKPWVLVLLVFFVLRLTGALSSISYLTTTAIMKTGMMDASGDEPAVLKKFNYDFTLRDLEGKVVDVNGFKGKTIFLNIWATWCGPCRVEMPSIQNLYSQVDSTRIVFIMLSVDRSQDIHKVRDFVADKGYTFPVYTPAGNLPEQLQVGSIPSTFIIGPDGRIASKETGAANYDTPEFNAFLQKLAAQ